MKRADLLKYPPLKATQAMLKAAAVDTGTVKRRSWNTRKLSDYTEYKYKYYFRAKLLDDGRILEVDLFTGSCLRKKTNTPQFRIFLDAEEGEFTTYDMDNKKWSDAKLYNLNTDENMRPEGIPRGQNYASVKTASTVNEYLKTGDRFDVEEVIIRFQDDVRSKKRLWLRARDKVEMEQIDIYMHSVPEKLSSGWDDFVNKKVLQGGHCIFFKKSDFTGYCTCCKSFVSVPEDVKHNTHGQCRQCKTKITYKSWNRQKSIRYQQKAGIFQRCNNSKTRYVYRQFWYGMYAKREDDYVPVIISDEEIRVIVEIDTKIGFGVKGRYEKGMFKNTGINRWCHYGSVRHGFFDNSASPEIRSILYTANLQSMLKNTSLKYIPVAPIIKACKNTPIKPISAFEDMKRRNFPYEIMWKTGLKQFTVEHITKQGTYMSKFTRINNNAKKPWDFLKLTKENMKQAVRIDASDRQIRIIQLAQEAGAKLDDKQVVWIDTYLGVSDLIQYFSIQTPHRIIRYLREKIKIEKKRNDTCKDGEKLLLHLWCDYLSAAQQLDWDLRDRQTFFPQDISNAHDEAARLLTIQNDRIEARKRKKEDAVLRKNTRAIKALFCFKTRNYFIKVPECYMDFRTEGHAQHNCVATYYERAVAGQCIILFIRERSCPDKAFCTVEIRNDEGRFIIMQNRTAYNREAPNEAQEFLKAAVAAAQRIFDESNIQKACCQ